MTATSPSQDVSLESLVAHMADEYQERCKNGERPDPEEYAARHPEFADLIRKVLASLEWVAAASLAKISDSMQTPFGHDEPMTGILGDYRIIRELGHGGMGVVYEAEQISLGRRVALKVLPFAGTMDQKQLQRFKNESHNAGSLDHPNIVRVYAVGCERGVHFYAMQLIEGLSLAEVLDELRLGPKPASTPVAPNGSAEPTIDSASVPPESADNDSAARRNPLADTGPFAALTTEHAKNPKAYYRRVAELGIQAAEALDYAHQMGIVHRDVKPANLMLDGRGNLWMTDFGLARNGNDANLTMTGDLLGTLRYMSPEQALAQRVTLDHRTDVYSLGVTLYELLTQQPAFDGKDRREVFKQIVFDEPRKPRSINKRIPAELETIVLKAMEKRPEDRYQTAKELGEDLRRWSKEEPIKARPPSRLEKTSRWCRRYPLAASFLLTMLAVTAVMSGLALWAMGERDRADANAVSHTLAKEDALGQKRVAEEKAQAETKANEKTKDALVAEAKAKTAAQGQLESALKRLTQLEKSNKILGSMFEKLDPAIIAEDGRPLQAILAERLDYATSQLDEEAIGDPLAVARIQMELGVTLIALGYPDKACILFAKAKATYLAFHGPEHPDTLFCMNLLGSAYSGAGKFDLALPLFQEVYKSRKAKPGPEHADTLTSMNNLAQVHKASGKLDMALTLFEETYKLALANLGPENRVTVGIMSNLAVAYEDAGRLDLALPLFEKTLKYLKANLGPEHPRTLVAMSNLGAAYREVGKLEWALPLFEDALKVQTARLGSEHPNTLTCKNNLGSAHLAGGKTELALTVFQETLKLQKARHGLDHPGTFASMGNLASAYQASGKLDLALPLFEESLKFEKAKLGPDHPSTLKTMNNLAWTYNLAGRLDLASQIFEETIKLSKIKLGIDHPFTICCMNNLGMTYLKSGNARMALPLIEKALQLAETKLGANHPKTLTTMSNMACAYHAIGKLDLAFDLFRKTLELQKGEIGPDHPDTLRTMQCLAEAYVSGKKLDVAITLFEETLQLRKSKLGLEHPDTLATMNNLASAYQAAGKLDLALPLFEDTLKLRKVLFGTEHPHTLSSMNNLALALRNAGKLDMALPLFEETIRLNKTNPGIEHSDTHTFMNNLALAYYDIGRLDLAVPLFEEALKLRRVKLGPENPSTLGTKGNLASAYLAAHRYRDAIPLFREYITAYRKRLPENGPGITSLLAQISLDLVRHKQFEEAEPLIRECLQIREENIPNDWVTFNTKCMLGACLASKKEFIEAEELLLDGYKGMKAREQTIPPQGKERLTESIAYLVKLYDAWDKPEEANKWRKLLPVPRSPLILSDPRGAAGGCLK